MNYDAKKYSVWTWKHPMMLHWIINPALAINELVLGQRIAKVMLVEKDQSKPFAERSFVPCPHCDSIHPGLKWSTQNKTGFRNWFGLYCDQCSKPIPCLRNLTSILLLAISFPVWYWFKESSKYKWLRNQPQRFSKPMLFKQKPIQWWHHGLGFGLFMFAAMGAFNYFLLQEPVTTSLLAINLLVWLIAGMAYGAIIKRQLEKKTEKHPQDPHLS